MKLCPSLTLSDCPPRPYFTYINTPRWESLRCEANINRRKLAVEQHVTINLWMKPRGEKGCRSSSSTNSRPKAPANTANYGVWIPRWWVLLRLHLSSTESISYQDSPCFFFFYFGFILSWKPRDVWPGKPASKRPVKKKKHLMKNKHKSQNEISGSLIGTCLYEKNESFDLVALNSSNLVKSSL